MEKEKNIHRWLFILFILFFAIFTVNSVSAASFSVNVNLIGHSMPQGTYDEQIFTIVSNEEQEFDVSFSGIPDVVLSESNFILYKNEQKDFRVGFNSANLSEGIYQGKISVKNAKGEIEIPVLLLVQSPVILFGGDAEIPLKYQTVSQGNNMVAQIKIYDLRGTGSSQKSEIEVNFKVYSKDGELLSNDIENVSVSNYLQVSKTISLNENIPPGRYFLVITTRYGSYFAGSVTDFLVIRGNFLGNFISFFTNASFFLYAGAGFLVLFIAFSIYHRIKKKKLEGNLKKQAGKIFQ